jgi:uncharacterized membrane protein
MACFDQSVLLLISILSAAPAAADVAAQKVTTYHSNRFLRLATGFLLGAGIATGMKVVCSVALTSLQM